jgi:hypothetical protein
MVKPYNYTDSELITLLIDGELTGKQKGYILDRMNSDNALSRQFKLESAIQQAAQAKPHIEPSEKLTGDLFDKLGFSNGNNEKPLIPWISALKKVSTFLAAGLVLTLIGYYAFTSMESTDKPKTHTLTEKKIPFVSSKSITANSNSTTKTKDDNNSESEKQIKRSKATKTVISANKVSKKAIKSTEPATDEYANTAEDKVNDNALINKSESEVDLESAPSMEEITTSRLFNNTSTIGGLFEQRGDFILQLNPFKLNSNYMSQFNRDNEILVKVMNPYRTNNFMTNGGLAVTYYRKWKGGCKIGIEAGFENIDRWTYNAQTTDKSFTNSQALSLSGILRYDAEFAQIADINPFVQTFFGFGTNFNYLYGGTVGLVYNPPMTRFGVQVGYEYRKFDYYFGSDNTTTMSFAKSGATASLIIKF